MNGSRRRTARKQKHPNALETHARGGKCSVRRRAAAVGMDECVEAAAAVQVKQEDIRDFCFFPLKSHTKLSRAA